MKELMVRIERVATEGMAIGRTETGKIVLTAYSVPGDTLKVRVDHEHHGHITGYPVEIIRASPARVTPKCPYHFHTPKHQRNYCGGCNWQHISTSAQLEFKRQIVIDALNRIGGFKTINVRSTLASPKVWRYRNKVQVPFRKGAGGEALSSFRAGGSIQAGFYVPGSHQVVDFDDCLVQPEISVKIVHKVKKLCHDLGLEPYDEEKQSGWLRHLLIRVNKSGEVMVTFITRTPDFYRRKEALEHLIKSFPEIIGIHQNVQPRDTSVILGREWKKIWGADFIMENIGNMSLRLSPGSFFQVNLGACEILYDVVKKYVFPKLRHSEELDSRLRISGMTTKKINVGAWVFPNSQHSKELDSRESGNDERKILDVYSGVGALALWLAYGNKNVNMVTGLEESPQAVSDACWNATNLNINNAKFIRGRAEEILPGLLYRLDKPTPGPSLEGTTIAVIDPPRSGCDEKVIRALGKCGLKQVIYVSCNPATFSRDAKHMAQMGYELKEVQPVDLFPQTSHVELVGNFLFVRHSRMS